VRETCELPRHHVRTIDGMPVTSPERTLLDLYGVIRSERADQAVKAALRMGLTTLGRLAVVLTEVGARGRPGTAGLRAIVAKLDTGEPITESELEDLVESVAAAHGLPRFRRQVAVGDTTAPLGRVDFMVAAGLIVEADSRAHHGDWDAIEADRVRDLKLAAAGYRVIRVTWRVLVDQPGLFANAVRKLLTEAAA
jgi:very-short-patch-repair endonuclease